MTEGIVIAVSAGAFLAVASAAVTLFLTFTFARYMGVLKDPGCKNFTDIVADLYDRNTVQSVYVQKLGRFLARVDRFFDGWEDTQPRPSAWSAHAYDRCLLLAVAYPIVSALLAWAVVGEAGQLGAALGLAPTDTGPYRVALLLGLGCVTLCWIAVNRAAGWRKQLFF